MAASPTAPTATGMRLNVRLTPGARAARVGDIVTDDAGASTLKIYVTEPPESGRANQAMIRLLAKLWHLPKSTFAIASGHAGRREVVVISGDNNELLAHFAEGGNKA